MLLSRYRAKFEGNLLCFVRARAYVRARMAQKSYAAGMRNAKLGNHLKFQFGKFEYDSNGSTYTKLHKRLTSKT